MKKGLKRLVIAGLAGSMVIGCLTGCTPSDSKTLATIGENTLTYGEGNFYARYYQASYEQYAAMYGYEPETFWSQYVEDGVTMEQNSKDSIKDTLISMEILDQHTDEYDVSLSDEEKENITKAAEDFIAANDEETIKVMSATQANVERVMELITISEKMREAMIADVDREVTDEEALRKDISYVAFTYDSTNYNAELSDSDEEEAEETDEKDSDKKDADEKASDKKDASEDADKEDSGEDDKDPAEVADELASALGSTTNTTALEQAQEFYDKAKKCKTADDFAQVAEDMELTAVTTTVGQDTDDPSEAVAAYAFDLKKGKVCEPFNDEDGNAYYVILKTSNKNEEASESAVDTIIADRENDAYQEQYDEWKEATEIKWDDKVWEKISFIDQGVSIKTEDEETGDESADETAEDTENVLNTDPSLVAEEGDTVNIDFAGFMDGEQFDGGTAAGQDVVLGSGTMIEGFEEQIVGHSPGETFDIDVTFPEEYGNNSELAGKDATFTITLNGIYNKE